MGTRGMYGFYRDGETKATYNHFDSYPECLGSDIITFVRNTPIREMNEIFDKIQMVSEDSKPTQKQVEECIAYFDNGVSTGSVNEWYSLLHKSQGDLNAYKHGLKYMIDSQDFIKDSLFCEWAYIINLDTNQLEVYEGFQTSPSSSRYAEYKPDSDGYYPCKLIVNIDFASIKKHSVDDMVRLINEHVTQVS